jgi:threonyl-tRNA synthetase
MPRQKIKIVLPDGKEKEGISFETTALDVAKQISNSLVEKIVVAKVRFLNRVGTLDQGLINPDAENAEQGEQWELYDSFRPLEGDCEIKLLTFDDPEGKMVFWHSSAHILGECMEREYGVHLCHGPPTDSGFFYDAYCGQGNFSQANYKPIEDAAKKVVTEKQVFQRIILTKEEALRLFAYNPFKV